MSERDGLQESVGARRSTHTATDDDPGQATEAEAPAPIAARQGRFTSRVRETLREFDARPRPSKPAA